MLSCWKCVIIIFFLWGDARYFKSKYIMLWWRYINPCWEYSEFRIYVDIYHYFIRLNLLVKVDMRWESASSLGAHSTGWRWAGSVVAMVVIPKKRNGDALHPVVEPPLAPPQFWATCRNSQEPLLATQILRGRDIKGAFLSLCLARFSIPCSIWLPSEIPGGSNLIPHIKSCLMFLYPTLLASVKSRSNRVGQGRVVIFTF